LQLRLAKLRKTRQINAFQASTHDMRTYCIGHRLSINKPTKRRKEKSPSDGHCQCQKEIDGHLLACPQILDKEPRSDTPR
jgi:hypothetical protein